MPPDRRQLVLRQRPLQRDHLLQHPRLLQHHDDQRQVLVHADQLQQANSRLAGVRRRHHGGVAHACGQDRGRQVRPLFQFARGLVELVADRLLGVVGQVLFLHQRLDVVAVTGVGRHAARRRVRLGDVPLFLERGHVVAHSGRGDTQLVPLDERVRADRLGRPDVLVDYVLEEPAASFCNHDSYLD